MLSKTLRSIDRRPNGLCRRCKPLASGAGYLLTDSAGVRMFFCEGCTRKLVQAIGPAAGAVRPGTASLIGASA